MPLRGGNRAIGQACWAWQVRAASGCTRAPESVDARLHKIFTVPHQASKGHAGQKTIPWSWLVGGSRELYRPAFWDSGTGRLSRLFLVETSAAPSTTSSALVRISLPRSRHLLCPCTAPNLPPSPPSDVHDRHSPRPPASSLAVIAVPFDRRPDASPGHRPGSWTCPSSSPSTT
jgi:hypothetical protein